MTFENDPNRSIDPDRPARSRFQYRREDGFGWVPMILAVAAVVLLIMLLLPSSNDTTGPRVTENTSGTNQTTTPKTPTTPPANKPAPTAPSPQK